MKRHSKKKDSLLLSNSTISSDPPPRLLQRDYSTPPPDGLLKSDESSIGGSYPVSAATPKRSTRKTSKLKEAIEQNNVVSSDDCPAKRTRQSLLNSDDDQASTPIAVWYKQNIIPTEPGQPRTLPLPDSEIFKYSKDAPRRSERIATRSDEPPQDNSTTRSGTQNLPINNGEPTHCQHRFAQMRPMIEPQQPQYTQLQSAVHHQQSVRHWASGWGRHEPTPMSGYDNSVYEGESSGYSEPQFANSMSQASRVNSRNYYDRDSRSIESSQFTEDSQAYGGKKKRRNPTDADRNDPNWQARTARGNAAVQKTRRKKKLEEEAKERIFKNAMRQLGREEAKKLISSESDDVERGVFNKIYDELFPKKNGSSTSRAN